MPEPINDLAAHLPETRVEPAPAHLVVVSKRLWKLLLVIGGAIWILAAAVTEITDDHVLVPLVINLGSFLVPITMVAFALSRRREGFLTIEQIALAFLAAGTLGVMTTALLEIYLLPATTGTFIGVGIIEEIGKGAVLVAIAYLVPYRDPRNGMVPGAIVGAGFASFESAGYAISTLLDHLDASPIVNIMETEATRALLAPFGHITWTALLGGALFASSPERVVPRDVPVGLDVRGRRRAARAVGCRPTAGPSCSPKPRPGPTSWSLWPNAETWYRLPTSEELLLYNVFYDALIAINALIGTAWVVLSWRAYGREEPEPTAAGAA